MIYLDFVYWSEGALLVIMLTKHKGNVYYIVIHQCKLIEIIQLGCVSHNALMACLEIIPMAALKYAY